MGKGPRRINLVSILVVLVIAGAIYAGVKFVPVYLLNSKVDTILAGAKYRAAELDEFSDDSRRQALIDDITEQIVALGVDERYLEVYLEDDLSYIHADYRVVVKHPFGKTTTLECERSVEVPRD